MDSPAAPPLPHASLGTEPDASFGTEPGDPARAALLGGPDELLAPEAVEAFVTDALGAYDLDGADVCLVVPDATRSCPLPQVLAAVHRALHGRVRSLVAVVALGTHQAMSDQALAAHLGYAERGLAETYPGLEVVNHEHWDPDTFVTLGTIAPERVTELSGGRLHDQGVDVQINRRVAEADVALVVGPVFPHEVVGFSGGNKYFYPGVAGADLIDLSHWVGALITSATMIGSRGVTPVRALINEAAAMIPAERLAVCLVVASGSDDLHAVSVGTPEDAWAAAAAISAETHVTYLDRPYARVLSIMPTKYQDIWTGAKGFYKLEPVVADGGELIIFAPHITQVSEMHPDILEIGYHNRDYFVGQWDRFAHHHWGVLAHSTHLRGQGTWSPEEGEHNRVRVTLATGIPREVCESINLGYLDPAEVDVAAYEADPDTLVVPNAGEVLHRLRG